ncbi:MAG: DUF1844 domain-containing protein [Ignavibacteriaceae bacterium]
MEQNYTNEILFMQLIMQNQQVAMMSMGKIKNPVSDKIERNLEYAKLSIDTLDMLTEKTKGNLSEYEQKFLTEVIRELKLNYVDEVSKDKNKPEPGTEENKENNPAQ